MFNRLQGRWAAVALVSLLVTACGDKKLKEKQDDLPRVELSLHGQTVKPWYGARWTDPEPVQLKVTLQNHGPFVVDVLNRFIPAREADPGMLSPLTVILTDMKTGRRVPIERFEEPDRPTWRDFKTLGPDESVSSVIDLRDSFPSLRQPGQYRVQLWYQFGDKEAEDVRTEDEFKKGWFWTGRQQVWPWSGRLNAAPLTITLKRVAEPPPPKPTPAPAEHGGGHGESGGHGAPAAGHGAPAGHEPPAAGHDAPAAGHGAPAAAHGAATPPPAGHAKPEAHKAPAGHGASHQAPAAGGHH